MMTTVYLILFLAGPDGDLPISLADQNPPPQQEQQQPAPRQTTAPPPAHRHDDDHDRWYTCPVTISASARAAFPLGSIARGSGVNYDDLFDTGWGVGAEASFLVATWGDKHDRDEGRFENQALGFYISAQWDRFEGEDDVAVGGATFNTERMTVQSGFVGFKHHVPWGGGFYHDMRVGGGFIHYEAVDASTAGGLLAGRIFENSWGVAAEAGIRIGYNFKGFAIFLGAVGRAAEGPDLGAAGSFASTASTFYTAAAEGGIELRF